jgi:hypothetical protein
MGKLIPTFKINGSEDVELTLDTKLTDQEVAQKLAKAKAEERQRLSDYYNGLRQSNITYISDLEAAGKDTLVINDILFAMPENVFGKEAYTPPVAISIDKQMVNFRWQTLRTRDTQKMSSGQTRARIGLTLFFVGLHDIKNGLRRLIATFNTIPFIYIENSFIRANLMPNSGSENMANLMPNSGSENMACTLVGMSIKTVQGMTNVLAVDLDLMWFNYKPYTNNFYYRKSRQSIIDAPKTTEGVFDKNLTSSEGIQ